MYYEVNLSQIRINMQLPEKYANTLISEFCLYTCFGFIDTVIIHYTLSFSS